MVTESEDEVGQPGVGVGAWERRGTEQLETGWLYQMIFLGGGDAEDLRRLEEAIIL